MSEGGKHDIEQMIVLCPNHHDRVHEGSLWIHGSRAKGFSLTMADGSPYGSGAPSPKTVVNIEVFQGLRRLGFQEKEIRPVLEALRDRGLPTDALVREALKMLGRRKASPTWEAARETDAAPTSAPPSQETGASDHGASTATSEADTAKDAFEGLRGLGFTELEIRPVLVSLRARDLALADLLRESLKMLHRSRSAPTWEKPITATPGRPRKYRLRPTESEGVAEREVAYRTRNRNSMNLLGDAPPTRRMRLRASGRRRGIAQSPGRSPTWERAMRYPADQSTRP